jgi:hypothetical protein
MAYRHHVLRLTAFGSCYGGAEEWSTGFYMGEVSADAAVPDQLSADGFLTDWTTFWTTSNVGISNKYSTQGVRVARLHKDTGKTIPGEVFYAYPTVPVVATGGTAAIAPQLTIVASLQARPDAGLGAKGRMFLPGVSMPIGNDGHLIAADTLKVATGVATLFNNLNSRFDLPGSVINASRGRNLGLFNDQPVNRLVEDVLVGNVYDTQRRRRNQLNEAYSTMPVTA